MSCAVSWAGGELARGWRGRSGGAGPSGRVGGSLSAARAAVVAASRNSLAIDADGFVHSWGFNDSRGGGDRWHTTATRAIDDSGQLGRGGRKTPEIVQRAGRALAIASGRYHALAVAAADRSVVSWGLNDHGQLGRAGWISGSGSAGERRCREGARCRDGLPRSAFALRPPQLPPVAAVAAGRYFSVAVTESGRVFAWGRCACGRAGADAAAPPVFSSRPYEVRGGGVEAAEVAQASAGYAHLLLRTRSGAVFSCESGDDGYGGRLRPAPPPNAHGQLGRGGSPREPRRVEWEAAAAAPAVRAVAAGRCASFATDGAATTWGWGCAQANGAADGADARAPAPIAGLAGLAVRALAAGEYHALALLDDGRVLTWGTGAGARLPVRALELGGVATAVAAGYQHSLAIVNASGGCSG